MARLIVQSANPGKQIIDLKLGTNRIGRGAENDFPIEHPTLSTLHCELVWIDEMVRVRDFDSTNGVFVNDEPVKEAVLQPGQILRLGSVELYVESTTARISVPELPSSMPAPPIPLADGSVPCKNHERTKAAYRCTYCGVFFCIACIHRLSVAGSKNVLRLCPDCSGHLETLTDGAPRKRKGIMAYLSHTLRLPFKRKRPAKEENVR